MKNGENVFKEVRRNKKEEKRRGEKHVLEGADVVPGMKGLSYLEEDSVRNNL